MILLNMKRGYWRPINKNINYKDYSNSSDNALITPCFNNVYNCE